ncbi:cupin domain-containing protein [Paenibacillus sp. FSL H7-0918]|uniref:cupin domain-containing protein n=1 Tax=Paenibacillus sp. FSL H7-0918 TaxID=2921442 RepID=UPI0030F95D70
MSGITAGKVFFLTDMISVKPHRIASRTLSLPVAAAETAAQPEWVLYAMDQEETISSETSPKSKIIHVLEGELHLLVAAEPYQLTAGASVIVPASTWHDYSAHSSCKFLQISI